MCQRACPESCFDIEGARDAANKLRPTRFNWVLERCTFCGLCVEACPTAAIRFSREFRLSSESRAAMRFTLETMYSDYDLKTHFGVQEPAK
jgi:NADH-quinone oxidoreductase subunit I